MSFYNEESKLINIFNHILMILLGLPLLVLLSPFIVLCLACLCLPLFVSGALVYVIYCEGLFASMPWLSWPVSIWIISIGLFGTGKMLFDTSYRGN